MTQTEWKRVVVVEDNPHDIFLVREALKARRLNVQLIWFGDIPEALSSLLSEDFARPDAMLLDLNLPRGEGLEILEAVRATGRLAGVPVAVLTSSESPKDKERALSFGVNAYIIKPLDLGSFLENVGQALEELLNEEETPVTIDEQQVEEELC